MPIPFTLQFTKAITSTGTGSLSMAIGAAPDTPGDLLVVGIAARGVGALGGNPTINGPSGWTAAGAQVNEGTNTIVSQVFWRLATGSDGPIQADIGSNTNDMFMCFAEVAGPETPVSVDQLLSPTGNSTTPDSGLSGTTANANEYIFGFIADLGSKTQSAPTGGFTQEQTASSGNATPGNQVTGGLYDQIAQSAGTFDLGCTLSASAGWIVWLVSFLGQIQAGARVTLASDMCSSGQGGS